MEFNILTKSEEEKLSLEDRKKYYANLKKYLLDRKLTNTTPGATTIGPKLKKVTTKIANGLVNVLSGCKVEREVYGLDNIPDGPALFGFNHSGLLDNFSWMLDLERHCIILHGSDAKKAIKLMQLNTGLILVDKNGNNKKNMNNAKLDMMELLLKGNSIVYFPEATWNLSPNKLMLPMRYGIMDIAMKTGCPVVPAAIDYEYDYEKDISKTKEKVRKIRINYGKPIYVNEYDRLEDKMEEYRDEMSTLLYEIYEKKGLNKRVDMDSLEYQKFMKNKLKSLSFGGIDINRERDNIWGATDDKYLYQHINDVPYTESGNYVKPIGLDEIEKYNKKIKNK